MIATRWNFKHWCAGALMALAVAQGSAAEVNGIRFDNTIQLGGKELVLNGAGMRTRLVFKIYAVGLYLGERHNNVADILKQEGPRRIVVVMTRDISSTDFGDAFMKGISDNTTDAEKSRYASQIAKFGEMFGAFAGLKKGDVLHLDLIPGAGTQTVLNGKILGEPIPDAGFYNAILRIWLGEHAVDAGLKKALLTPAR